MSARADRVNVTLHANLGCLPHAWDTARNSENSLARDTVVHVGSFRNSGNSANSGGDTVAPACGTLQQSTCHGTRCQNATPRTVEETSCVLQQRVIDAETKLLKQNELLGETERSFEELDDSIKDLISNGFSVASVC